MIRNFILEQTNIPLLNKALDVYSLRQRTISSNISNVNTVGYREKEVKFEEMLQNQMSKQLGGLRTDKRHIPLGRLRAREVRPQVLENKSDDNYSGVNNVDIDKQVVEQVKNEIRYMYASRILSANFAALRASIKGRFDR